MTDARPSIPITFSRRLWGLAARPALRRLPKPRMMRLAGAAAARSLAVRRPLLFTLRELRGGARARSYRLRESGLTVVVRHGTPDVFSLEEIFLEGVYRMPAQVMRSLEAADKPLLVMDLGANVGLFGAYALGRFPAAQMVGFEPDHENFALLEHCVVANGRRDAWRTVEACASNEAGTIAFRGGGHWASRAATEREHGEPVPAVDVLPALDGVDLLKMNLEGGEWPILTDRRFPEAAPRAIALLYHAHMCPERRPRLLAVRLLEDAGYTVDPVFERASGDGMLWAWRA